jgi:transcriptional regulator with XRE-family HTH domain
MATNIIELKKIMIDKSIEKIGDLSRISGVNRKTLGLVLRGRTQPSSDVMNRLVIALEIPPEQAGKIFFNQ